MPSGRTIAWLLTIGAAALFTVSIFPMASRIRAFNASQNFPNFRADELLARHLHVTGFPDADLADAAMPDGSSALRLDYADKSTLIPVKKPPARDIPNLSGYDEWMRALVVYEVERGDDNRQYIRQNSERLLIVSRRTPEGYDPDAMGQVRRIEWVFDFYDLKRDGSIDRYTRRFPRKKGHGDAEARLAREARGEADDPKRIAEAKYLIQFEPLKERSIDYFAALFVVPKLSVPEYKFNDTAFNFRVLGWTLPGAMGSALLFTGALAFALAPARGRARTAPPLPSP